jgi:hypothetical protein
MIGTTAAIIGAAAIGAGTQLYGASQAAKGAKKGAAAVAAQNAKNEAMLAPYTSSGENALRTYNTAVGLDGRENQQKFYDEFEHDPGWEAANEFGAKTVDDRYRLSGQGGGNVRAALYDYGQKNLLSAYTTRLSQLGGLVDTGRSAASTLATTGNAAAAQQGSLLSQAGLLQGQGITGAGNAIAGGMNNLANYNMYTGGMNAGMTPGTMANGGWSTQITSNNANRYFN